jgi:LacI family transcriptional regulator
MTGTPPTRVTTLQDVALLAGVSTATASKALADRYGVRASTRQRVLEAADQLHFTPNSLARDLLRGGTQSIGIITSNLDGRFAPKVVRGTEEGAASEDSSVILCNSRGDPALESHYVGELLKRRVRGLVLVSDNPEDREPLARPLPIPVAYAYSGCASPAQTSFVSDDVAAGRMAAEALIAAGRRRIAHITGPASQSPARNRARGVVDALAAAGLSLVGGTPMHGSWSESWGWIATARLLDSCELVDAIVCGGDQIGHGARLQLDRSSVEVPGAIGLVGFDNSLTLNRESRLPFSSVDMQLTVIGRAAGRALAAGPGGLVPGRHLVPGTLVHPARTL